MTLQTRGKWPKPSKKLPVLTRKPGRVNFRAYSGRGTLFDSAPRPANIFLERLATKKMFNIYKSALLLAALAVGGCSIAGNGLWPDTADQPAERTHASPTTPTGTERVTLGDWANPLTASEPLVLDLPASREATATDSFVGKKVVALRSDLNMLIGLLTGQNEEYGAIAGSTAQISQRYEATVKGIRARLTTGAAPNSPDLTAQLKSAGEGLELIDGGKPQLAELSARVSANTGVATYISASAKSATGVQGGAEKDHQHLAQIVEDVAQVMAENDRLLNEISTTIARNEAAVAAERTNLTALAAAVSQGSGGGASQPVMAVANVDASTLIAIGFGRSRIEYEQALYDAVSAALNQWPDARFELVAVTPQRGGSGRDVKRNTVRVFRSLIDMGLPSERVILASETSNAVTTGEVQLHTR